MFDDLDTARVESELVGLAGHLAAGTCRFLQLLAEFDVREGWVGPGLRSCAHWLNWRVGTDLRTARDHLRVAHALTALPATAAAFAAGTVSYSKVRALTRIATADNEDVLLGIARHGTAAQLDTLVRAARAGADPRPAAAQRGLRYSRAEDGSLLVRLRIPAERGEQLLAAIQAVLDAADADPPPPEPPPADPTDADHPGIDPTVVDPPIAEATGGGSAEPSDDEPTRSAAAGYFPGAAEQYRRHQADRAELLARGTEHAPGPVLDPIAARRLDALFDLITGDQPAAPAKLVVHLRVDDLDEKPATTGRTTLRPIAWLDGGPAIPAATAERITCTAPVQALLVDRVGNPLYLGRTRRTASPQQLMALRVRDGSTCAFPGCSNTRHLEAHHVRWWRHHGTTDLDNLILICGFHHDLVHDHGYRIDALGDGRFTFARPDGTPVPPTGPPPSGTADDLIADHTARHIAIDDWTITPQWGGERLDPDPVLHWLIPELRAAQAA